RSLQSCCSAASSLSNGTPPLRFSDIDRYSVHARERGVELLHRAVHAHARSAGGAAEGAGQVVVVFEYEAPEPDDLARGRRNFRQRSRDQSQVLLPGGDLLARAMIDEARGVLVTVVVGDGAPVSAAQVVEGHVAGDVEDPGLAAALAAIAGSLLQQLEEHILDQVLARRGTARQLQAVLIDAAVVTLEQRAEARRIAVSHPPDQLFVGYCLHDRFRRLAHRDGRSRKTLRKGSPLCYRLPRISLATTSSRQRPQMEPCW